jgi:hypothetical protein
MSSADEDNKCSPQLGQFSVKLAVMPFGTIGDVRETLQIGHVLGL